MNKIYNFSLKVATTALIVFSVLVSIELIVSMKESGFLVTIISLLIVWVLTYLLAKYILKQKKENVVTPQERFNDTVTIQPITRSRETQRVNHRVDTPSPISNRSSENGTTYPVNDIEKRILELQTDNPNISEEEIKAIILAEKKNEILKNISSKVEIQYTNQKNDRSPNPTHSKLTSDVIPEEKLAYTKTRKLISNFVVLDFETTGLSNASDEIIQVAAVRYKSFIEIEKFVSFIKPIKPIPNRITEITGISDTDVKTAPSIKEVLPKLISFIDNDVIIAHNAPFDMKFLLSAMHKEGIDFKRFKVIDTLTLARKHIDSTKNHKLPTLKSFLRLNHLGSHEALHDCYVAAELYKYCYQESLVNK